MKGKIFVISGPSGVGKGTLVKKLLSGDLNLHLSISATTRKMRDGEAEGVNYYYKTYEEFMNMIENNQFIEWAKFCNNYYGTPKKEIEKILDEGTDVILEIEIQGAMEVKKNYPECVMIFILPPSVEELKSRLVGRGTETQEAIDLRIETSKKEMKCAKEYDYLIVNGDIDKAVYELETVIISERCRTNRVINDLEVLK